MDRVIPGLIENIVLSIDQCLQLLRGDSTASDIVIVRLESTLSAIRTVDSQIPIPWAALATRLIDDVVSILSFHLEFGGLNRSRVGRPAITIPIHRLEYLLSAGFKIPDISSIVGVSKSTIKRRLMEGNLSVSHFGGICGENIEQVSF